MGIYKSYKRRFQLKNCNKIRLEKQKKSQRDKIINEIKNNQRFLNSLLNNYNKIIVKLLI
ncbi:hypothetical protein RhiirA4_121786 [Rhizophagus irregularis]|uniref:Uncharacterized protein n=1 Tax=Rhizophagus irregularis TaxID=588596 RepID=A0A2I1GAD0_9GLOM|nr:hypothetical protein RhiirA4_121786 [Rhizophagus irregularis]